MPRINDIAYVTYRCPDLDLAERFLGDFGMLRAARTENALYMRGAGPRHHTYVARRAAPPALAPPALPAPSPPPPPPSPPPPARGPPAPPPEPGGGHRGPTPPPPRL